MITIKNKIALSKMQKAGELLASVFYQIDGLIKPGVTTQELDAKIEAMLIAHSLVPQAKGFRGYKHATCISVNDEVVHGVPGERVICDGDLVKVDICAAWNGYCADMARCFFVGNINPDVKKLVEVAQVALDAGIRAAIVGNRVSDVSIAIQQEVEKHNFGIVRDFAGHGIGKSMHEEPEVPNFGSKGQGALLRHGMTLAIEPMITLGDYKVYLAKDGWTAKTKDGKFAAHIEDTIAITEDGPKILTRSFKG